MPTLPYSIPESCDPRGRILFIGNVRLHTFTETAPAYLGAPATRELQIDVIARPEYAGIYFRDIRLILRMVTPAEAAFVGHSNRRNHSWEVPHPDYPATWRVESDTLPSRQLRIREDTEILLSPEAPLDGRTYRIGITGVDASVNCIQFKAFVDGYELPAQHESCEVTFDCLRVSDNILGYIPNLTPGIDL